MEEVAEFGDVNSAIDFHTRAKKGRRVRRAAMHPEAKLPQAAPQKPASAPQGSRLDELLALVPSLSPREAQIVLMRCGGCLEKAVQELMLDPPSLRAPEEGLGVRTARGQRKARSLAKPVQGKSKLQIHLEGLDLAVLQQNLGVLRHAAELQRCQKENLAVRGAFEELVQQLARHMNCTAEGLRKTVFFTE
eukprot:TRINITY_DN60835_c0_g1_i1.p1 TRINITY_DN60835_c0_g1~~TRINITY_DN60835_c0_g1_i1.p1  ORF type:complete len:206 (+),score=84.57 TRINITY_DN60835_c0_g1_i1:46-618(+)